MATDAIVVRTNAEIVSKDSRTNTDNRFTKPVRRQKFITHTPDCLNMLKASSPIHCEFDTCDHQRFAHNVNGPVKRGPALRRGSHDLVAHESAGH